MSVSLRGTVKLTYEQFQKIPYDGLGHHLVNGEHIVTPAPSTLHQEISTIIFKHLINYIDEKKIGKVFTAPTDVKFSSYDGYQPDLMFISNDQIEIVTENFIAGPPRLIIEITSKDSAKDDYGWKKNLAERYGVDEYWIVDTTYKLVEVFNFKIDKLKPRTFTAKDSIISNLTNFNDFKIQVNSLFP